jgi:FtsZ-binding cell division protein ZapB
MSRSNKSKANAKSQANKAGRAPDREEPDPIASVEQPSKKFYLTFEEEIIPIAVGMSSLSLPLGEFVDKTPAIHEKLTHHFEQLGSDVSIGSLSVTFKPEPQQHHKTAHDWLYSQSKRPSFLEFEISDTASDDADSVANFSLANLEKRLENALPHSEPDSMVATTTIISIVLKLQAEIEALKAANKDLQAENRAIKAANKDLQAETRALKADTIRLQDRLDIEIRDRRADTYKLIVNIESLEEDNKKFKAQNRSLSTDNKARMADDFAQKTTIRNLQDDNRDLRDQMTELGTKNDQLLLQVDELMKQKERNQAVITISNSIACDQLN